MTGTVSASSLTVRSGIKGADGPRTPGEGGAGGASSLDLSAKLLWTRQESDSVTEHGDRVRFKDADSLRTRLGGRFSYAASEQFSPYVGAYWGHEYDSKARSTVNGNNINAPDLKGDTGMGELDINFKPMTDSGLSFDLAGQGDTGVREGVT